MRIIKGTLLFLGTLPLWLFLFELALFSARKRKHVKLDRYRLSEGK